MLLVAIECMHCPTVLKISARLCAIGARKAKRPTQPKSARRTGQGRLSKPECVCVYVLGMGVCLVDD